MDPATGGVLISGLKALHDMVKSNKDPGATMTALLEIQSQVFELMNEAQALKGENAHLKAELAAREEVESRPDGAIWRKTDAATHEYGGNCPNCYAESGKLLRLYVASRDYHRSCTVCKFHITHIKWWN